LSASSVVFAGAQSARRRFADDAMMRRDAPSVVGDAWRGDDRGRLDPPCVRRHLTVMRTTVSTKGQIIIPAEIRRQDGIQPGDEFSIERRERGEYVIKLAEPPRNAGVVDWLSGCPEKGWFTPIEGESTDAL